MATLRAWLTKAGFNWERGRIIWHDTGSTHTPGSDFASVVARVEVDRTHPILDYEFNDGFGELACPRIFARCDNSAFFPVKYDGATELVVVGVDVDYYLTSDSETPYPGGG